jgi:hypothetical protein
MMSINRLMAPPTGATLFGPTLVSGIGLAISDMKDRPFKIRWSKIK